MNVHDHITRLLQPLRGSLRIDAYTDRLAALRRAATERPAPERPLRAEAAAAGASGPRAARRTAPHEPSASETDDRGNLRQEVLDFMSRDNPSDTDADEIREFMKEHPGYDPTQPE